MKKPLELHDELPPLKPGETRVLIDASGDTVIFLTRHPLSIKPEPDLTLAVPTDQLLLTVCQAVLQRARRGQQPSNVLPGTGAKPPNM